MLINGNDDLQLNIESLDLSDGKRFAEDKKDERELDEKDEGDSVDELDLSSISSIEEDGGETDKEEGGGQTARDAESLYEKTLAMIQSGEIDTDGAIMLLSKAASDGCYSSALYLGSFYADPQNENHNPTLAYDNFLLAAQLGSADGCYKVGLCISCGFGCDKNDALAVELFNRGAECDHADCIFALGTCLEFGIGCEINYPAAARFYERASELGHADATNNLGGLYFYGHGVPEDKDRAITLYKKAAELGSSNADCRLGVCLEDGLLGFTNVSEALECYKRSADKNNPIALYRLALCYDNGTATEQNFAKAYSLYCRAARLGSAHAMYEAGKMSLQGRGTKKDLTAAYKMFLSASATLPIAEYELGNCFFEGLGTVRNRVGAYARYLNAFEKDPSLADAAYRLGLCRLKGLGCDVDTEAAYYYFTEGERLGSNEAAYMKGECEFFGIGTECDQTAAVASFTKATKDGGNTNRVVVHALVSLGLCYERGLGVEADTKEALRIYKKAAALGDANAMYRTGRLMFSSPELKEEYSSARIFVLRAARKEHLSAMLTMGNFAAGGKGVPKSPDDAIRWYTKAVTTDIPTSPALFDFPQRFETASRAAVRSKIEAQYRLGMIIARRNPSPQELIKAFESLALAASMGHEKAQTEISKIFVSGGDLKEYYESPFSREKALFPDGNASPDDNTLSDAMNKLGDAFFDGKALLKKNQPAAVRCYKIAANLGHINAAYSYGWCLRHGAGVHENATEAVRWLKLAADKGNANAAYSYGLCCEEGAGTGIKNRRDALTYYRKAAALGHSDAANRYVTLSEREN